MVIYPVIPTEIVVHLGAPSADVPNVAVSFPEYIKNVASCELYPTWKSEALRANIYAQISVALNRVYTEYYRSTGKDFDITSRPEYDQTFIYGREIFENISEIVDEIFNSYLKRPQFVEPLFATFCDGIEVECNGLSQWGSESLAKEGKSAFEIDRYYYGDSLELVNDVAIEDVSSSAPPIALREGDTGFDVESLQIKLNRISTNFSAIPKIYPTDGFFDEKTTAAVKTFQSVFSLTPDGRVGKATWNKIQNVYNGVKRLATLNSEGIRISEFPTENPSNTLERGMVSTGVLTLQYYLSYISLFIPSIPNLAIDGVFGPKTENAVKAFQTYYGLSVNGIVDRLIWSAIEDVYLTMLSSVDYTEAEEKILPFPGRVLREGLSGDDIRAMQIYLNKIAESFPEVTKVTPDGVFGPKTLEQVKKFKERFGLSGNIGRINAQNWKTMTELYEDLVTGRTATTGQYPGYDV